jgi:hypothetical protein
MTSASDRVLVIAPGTALGVDLPQHPDEHRPERPVLLAVDQEFGDCPYDLGTNGKGNELIPAFRSGEARSSLNR